MLNGNIKHNVTIFLSSYFNVVIRRFCVCQAYIYSSLLWGLWISYVTIIVGKETRKGRQRLGELLWNSELFAFFLKASFALSNQRKMYATEREKNEWGKSVNIWVVDSKCRWFQNGSFCFNIFLFRFFFLNLTHANAFTCCHTFFLHI